MPEPIVVVIGLGEIGKPLFDHLQKAYPTARGVDLQPIAIDEPVGILHACYPFTPTCGFVETTVGYAEKYRPEILVVDSTVVPGTTREIERRTRIPTVYSPVRGKHVRMHADLLRYKKFVAGTDARAAARAAAHFAGAGLVTATMETPEALELAKLCETTYFGLLIAWAQEMERFARRHRARYEEIPAFFEEIDYLPRHAFVPGYIGGHCVMPNIQLLKTQIDSEMLDAIVASNERKAAEVGQAEIEKNRSKDRPRVEPLKLGSK